MSFLRFYPFFLLLSFFCFLSSVYAEQPNLPDIPAAIETQLYQGSAQEIGVVIGKRQTQIDGLIALITADSQKVKDKKEKMAFTAILDLFQGLPFQLKILQAELSRPESVPLQPPAPGSPPFKLALFTEIVSFQHKVAQQLGLHEENLANGEARTAAIKDEITALLPQYAKAKSEESSRVSAYETLAHILSLQHEYAILQLKGPKLNKALTDLRAVSKEAESLADQVFGQLEISKDDIAEIKKMLTSMNEHHTSSLAKLNAEHLYLNKQSVIAESKRDKAITAITLKAKEETAAGALESEKQRLELVLETIRFRKKAILQEKMNLDLTIKDVQFRQEWLTAYDEMSKGESPSAFIETWLKHEQELMVKKEALVRDLSLATQERADLT